jgi:hypothetical protein
VLCDRWPDTALFELVDRAGLSRALAARPAGPGWQPALPPSRWTAVDCRGASIASGPAAEGFAPRRLLAAPQ